MYKPKLYENVILFGGHGRSVLACWVRNINFTCSRNEVISQTPNPTTVSIPNKISSFTSQGSIKIKQENLIGTLEFWGRDEFEIDFQLFIRKYKPRKELLSLISTDNEQIVRVVTLPYRKLEFSLILDNHVVKITTSRIKIGRWNKCLVIQKKVDQQGIHGTILELKMNSKLIQEIHVSNPKFYQNVKIFAGFGRNILTSSWIQRVTISCTLGGEDSITLTTTTKDAQEVSSYSYEGQIKIKANNRIGILPYWGREELKIQFQLFVRKYRPRKEILSLISADNEQIVRVVTLPYRKLEFSLILDNHVVKITTPKIKIGRWNKIFLQQIRYENNQVLIH